MKLRSDLTHGENKTCTKAVARSGVQPQQALLDFGRVSTPWQTPNMARATKPRGPR